FLHVGHARTFATAADRARGAGLVLRIEDLDGPRCTDAFRSATIEDLRWLGLDWTEGPDLGGPHAPYRQEERAAWYLDVWRRLEETGAIYPSPHSRRDVEEAATAPHGDPVLPQPETPATAGGGDDGGERIFPPALRPTGRVRAAEPGDVAWRFRVPDGRTIAFHDANQGAVRRTAGVDFGDFVVWRRDRLAAYELAVVADDHAMEIAEVVRGADLLTSTARQILLYETLGWNPPAFCHVPLVRDASGRRLSKRAGGLSIRELRTAGRTPVEVLRAPLESLAARAGTSGDTDGY
ncbi:MAG: tRNA glutamyl-Q synthetase, partial [Planctomycetia bacterium]|nr:tRNA glutamyl-Q synthetase [Planctomycetia bacterium]